MRAQSAASLASYRKGVIVCEQLIVRTRTLHRVDGNIEVAGSGSLTLTIK